MIFRVFLSYRSNTLKPEMTFNMIIPIVYLQAIANREELVRTGKLTTIIFIRDYNSKGQEISGYIDLAQRIRTEDFVPYFDRRYSTY